MDDDPTPPATSEPTPIPPSDPGRADIARQVVLGAVVFVATLVLLVGLTGVIGRDAARSGPSGAAVATAEPPRRRRRPPAPAAIGAGVCRPRRRRPPPARPPPRAPSASPSGAATPSASRPPAIRSWSAPATSRLRHGRRRGDRAAPRRYRRHGLHRRRQAYDRGSTKDSATATTRPGVATRTGPGRRPATTTGRPVVSLATATTSARPPERTASRGTPTTSGPGTSSCSTPTAQGRRLRRSTRPRAAGWPPTSPRTTPTCTMAIFHHPRFSSGTSMATTCDGCVLAPAVRRRMSTSSSTGTITTTSASPPGSRWQGGPTSARHPRVRGRDRRRPVAQLPARGTEQRGAARRRLRRHQVHPPRELVRRRVHRGRQRLPRRRDERLPLTAAE